MKRFKEYLEQVELNPPEVGSSSASTSKLELSPYSIYARKPKPWKASKSDTLQFWQSLTPNIPLRFKPIEASHKGTTIQEDGVRITGSKEFITTVLSRLKDILFYENEQSKLIVDYRQNAKSLKPGKKDSYLFYVNVKNRN